LEARDESSNASIHAMADDEFDVEDDYVIPQINTDFTIPSRNLPARAPSPIQIDEEVVVKNKRKPAVKLVDRLHHHPFP
jgi:hypothetical protein